MSTYSTTSKPTTNAPTCRWPWPFFWPPSTIFLLLGFTASAFGSALQYVLTLLLSGSMDYRLANVVAIIAASVSNFLANDRWTFKRR